MQRLETQRATKGARRGAMDWGNITQGEYIMEMAIRIPTYDEHEKDWRRQHRAILPRKRRVTSFREWFWITFWVVVAVGAAVFSAVHTIPAAELTILATVANRAELARSIFTIIELVIFGAAALRKEIEWLKYLLAGALVVALIGNVSSSVRAVADNGGDILNQVGGIFMAVIAPFTALAAGEVLHIQLDKRAAKRQAAEDEFNAELVRVETMCRRDYNRLVKQLEKQQRDTVSQEDFMKLRELHESSQADMKSDEPKKPRVKLHEVAREIHENGDVDLSVDEMMRKYGISQGSTSKVRAILKGGGYMNGKDTGNVVQ